MLIKYRAVFCISAKILFLYNQWYLRPKVSGLPKSFVIFNLFYSVKFLSLSRLNPFDLLFQTSPDYKYRVFRFSFSLKPLLY